MRKSRKCSRLRDFFDVVEENILQGKRRNHMTIKEIAGLLRFSGTQHFTNLFREQFGTSPGKYREKTKANEHRR